MTEKRDFKRGFFVLYFAWNHEKRIHEFQDRLIPDKVRKHVVTRLRGQGSLRLSV
jgi:hypothetical protein